MVCFLRSCWQYAHSSGAMVTADRFRWSPDRHTFSSLLAGLRRPPLTMHLYKQRLLSAVQLRRLADHRYSCQSVSLLDSALQPWWCWLVARLPLWLAPNLITCLGLTVNVVTTLLLVWSVYLFDLLSHSCRLCPYTVRRCLPKRELFNMWLWCSC